MAANVTYRRLDGTKSLFLQGHTRYRSGLELATILLTSRSDTKLLGSKYARYLFDVYPWDAEPGLHGIFHRALLLALCCACKGRIIVVPSAVVYTHYDRPNSQSSLMRIYPEAVQRLWHSVSRLPLHRKDVIEWGLDIVKAMLIERGVPFSNKLPMIGEMRRLSAGLRLNDDYRSLARLVMSPRRRLEYCRRKVREGSLTAYVPHISFVIVAHNNADDVEHTVHSIFDTGFRNVEIVIVDDASRHTDAFRLHQLAINYPRVTLKKHPASTGDAIARLTGFKSATGRDIMFVRPGDSVLAEGLFEAMALADDAADVVFFASRQRNRFLPVITTLEFDPTACPEIARGPQAMLEHLDDQTKALPWPVNMVFDRKFLKLEHFNVARNPGDAENWTMLNVLRANPRIETTSKIGIIRD